MKVLMLFISLILLFSCDSPHETKQPEGEIIKVTTSGSETFIQVKFYHSGDDRFKSKLWFKGSDTCKVGQKVRLQ